VVPESVHRDDERPSKTKASRFSLLSPESESDDDEGTVCEVPIEEELMKYNRFKHKGLAERSCPVQFFAEHEVFKFKSFSKSFCKKNSIFSINLDHVSSHGCSHGILFLHYGNGNSFRVHI
jgi:hypothetical protein